MDEGVGYLRRQCAVTLFFRYRARHQVKLIPVTQTDMIALAIMLLDDNPA